MPPKKRAKHQTLTREQLLQSKCAAVESETNSDTAGTLPLRRPCCQRFVASHVDNTSRKAGHSGKEHNLLQELLQPLDADEFLKTSFRQHAVHIEWKHRLDRATLFRRFPNSRILQSLLNGTTVQSLIQETSSESIFVWLQKQQPSNPGHQPTDKSPPPLIHSIEVPDAETALKLHEISGHALYFRAPPMIEASLVGPLLRDTGLGGGQYDPPGQAVAPKGTTMGRGEVEVFVGGRATDRPCITGWHYDFQENFTIQLTGIKRWTLHPGIVQHPLRGCTPHYDTTEEANRSVMESQVLASRLAAPTLQSPTSMRLPNAQCSSGEEEVVEMHPGDVLYFPAGMWHTVETIEPGISINISLMASNYAAVTCQALQHLLLKHDEWRQCIQHCDSVGPSVVEVLQRLLQTLPSLIEKEMTSNGLSAQAILPPVLYTHPKPKMIPNGDAVADLSDPEDSDTDEDEDDSKDQVINVLDFVVRGVSNFGERLSRGQTLIQNPLAFLLHEETEIRQCYENFAPYRCDGVVTKSRENGDKNAANIYVLNVNFAGNESHESVVRVRLSMNPEIVASVRELLALPPSEKRASMANFSSDIVMKQHIDCLVYFGYLIWKESS